MSSLTHQVLNQLKTMSAFGESKYDAKCQAKDSNKLDKIYSYNTFGAYLDNAVRFAKWAKINHNIRHIDQITKEHAIEYLKEKVGEGKSAWSVQLYKSAINKVWGFDLKRQDANIPYRKREAISRSRFDVANDKKFNKEKHSDEIAFALACGCRREGLQTVRFCDVYKVGNEYYVHLHEKGGKNREARILDEYKDFIAKFVNTTSEKIFGTITKKIDIHSLRAAYATKMYKQLLEARGYIYKADYKLDKHTYDKDEKFNNKGCQGIATYICKDGRVLNKHVMLALSRYLGHNRINIIAVNYLR